MWNSTLKIDSAISWGHFETAIELLLDERVYGEIPEWKSFGSEWENGNLNMK